jgi:hypothetical protein
MRLSLWPAGIWLCTLHAAGDIFTVHMMHKVQGHRQRTENFYQRQWISQRRQSRQSRQLRQYRMRATEWDNFQKAILKNRVEYKTQKLGSISSKMPFNIRFFSYKITYARWSFP